MARSSRCISKEQIVAAVLESHDGMMQLEDLAQPANIGPQDVPFQRPQDVP